VENAINDTAGEFPEVPGVPECLRKWTDSEGFKDVLAHLQSGGADAAPSERVVTSFIEQSEFYFDPDSERAVVAEAIVATYFRRLLDHLYDTERFQILGRQNEAILQELRTPRSRAETAEPPALSANDEDFVEPEFAGLHAKIDAARELLKEGRLAAAKQVLEAIRDSAYIAGSSPRVRFRVLTNLGNCALEENDYEGAFRGFQLALEQMPESLKALANAAVGNLVTSRFDDALELADRALERDPRNGHAAAVRVQALHQLGRNDDVDRFLENNKWVQTHSESALSCASVLADRGQNQRARALIERKVTISPDDAVAHHMLGSVIVEPVQARLRKTVPFAWALREQDRGDLEAAHGALSRAVELTEGKERDSFLAAVLISRAAVSAFLGREENALADCEQAQSLAKDEPGLLRNLGILLFQREQPREALGLFLRIPDWQRDPDLVVHVARAAADAGEIGDALEYLRGLRERLPADDPIQVRIAETLLFLPEDRRDAAEPLVQAVLADLEARLPEHPEALRVRALFARQADALDLALGLLQKALALSDRDSHHRVRLALSEVFAQQGRPGEAADAIAELVTPDRDHPFLRRYAIHLFNAGRFGEALELSQDARGDGPALPVVTEIEATIRAYIGDVREAIRLRGLLGENDIEPVEQRLHAAALHISIGELDEARTIAGAIDPEAVDDAQTLMKIAFLRSTLEMDDVVSLAYRALRLEFGDPNVQLGYFWLFIREERRDREAFRGRETVAVGCTVHLRSEREAKSVTILDGDPGSIDTWEISPEDDVARLLVGKRVGERAVLRKAEYETLEYEIEAIETKYVRGFREVQANFTSRFPNHNGLFRVAIGEGDFSPIFRMLAQREADVARIRAHYRSQPVTIGGLSHLVGRNTLDTLEFLSLDENAPLIASSGRLEELQAEAGELKEARALVVDLTGAATIIRLGLLEAVKSRFGAIYSHPAAVRELMEVRENLRSGERTTTWSHGGQYFYREIGEDELSEGEGRLQEMIDFLAKEAELTPAIAALGLGRAKCDELMTVFGQEGAMAALVAHEVGAPLCSADLRLRQAGRQILGAQTASVQVLLFDLVVSGRIATEDYREALFTLTDWNFSWLAITAEDLLWLFEKERYEASPRVNKALRNLAGPNRTLGELIAAFTEIIRSLAMEGTLDAALLLMLDGMLEVLTQGFDPRVALQAFKNSLRNRLRLLPFHLERVIGSVELWERHRFR